MPYVYKTEQKVLQLDKDILQKYFKNNFKKSTKAKGDYSNSLKPFTKHSMGEILESCLFQLLKNNGCLPSSSKNVEHKHDEGTCNELTDMLKRATSEIRSILARYLQSQNISFLLGNGCSIYAGSKNINKPADNKGLIKKVSIRKALVKKPSIKKKLIKRSLIGYVINKLKKILPDNAGAWETFKDKKIEEVLNNLAHTRKYYEILKCSKEKDTSANDTLKKLDDLILEFKTEFLKRYVFTIDYNNNEFHKLFLKKVIARDTNKSKVNIFTLNYDLLIEKTTEELGILVNNGFMGFTVRKFDPMVYNIDYHVKVPESNRPIPLNKSINLFKLHGSISWFENEEALPYKVIEKQPRFEKGNNGTMFIKLENDKERPDYVIYPTYSKVRQSFDTPYSELFRQFTNILNLRNSTLFVIGYSFSDDHVNNIIGNALSNPNFNLVVFSYDDISANNSEFFKNLVQRSKTDSRVTLFTGQLLGSFEIISSYLLPYVEVDEDGKELDELAKVRDDNEC